MNPPADAEKPPMTSSTRLFVAACATALALLLPAAALAEHSVGSASQIAWVRSAATRFLTAELAGNGSEACGVLNAPLRASHAGRSCAQRWDGELAALLRQPGERGRLHAERRAVPSAVVIVHGNTASIELPEPLMSGPNHFVWTENCWMLKS